jgi:hypothetical protein
MIDLWIVWHKHLQSLVIVQSFLFVACISITGPAKSTVIPFVGGLHFFLWLYSIYFVLVNGFWFHD